MPPRVSATSRPTSTLGSASNAELRELLVRPTSTSRRLECPRNCSSSRTLYEIDGVGSASSGNPDQRGARRSPSIRARPTGWRPAPRSRALPASSARCTGEHTAEVRLLTDPDSGAAARVESSRAEGVVRGSLEGLLYLENLDADAVVNPGDVNLVTSGLGGSYAPGLIISTVVKVDTRQGESTEARDRIAERHDGAPRRSAWCLYWRGRRRRGRR